MTIIDGKKEANMLCDALLENIQSLRKKGIVPALRVILVGEDPASLVYVRNKEKKAASLSLDGQVIRMPNTVSQAEVLRKVDELNADKSVHGILVQLPLPAHLDENEILCRIDPAKDVDGLSDYNFGRLLAGRDGMVPCTPAGIIRLIKSTGIEIAGKHAVVIGRSNIVGKPVSVLLQRENATVTMCHSRTVDLASFCRQADILVVSIGKANFITGDMLKAGVCVIDVGMNRVDGKLTGDVHFESAKEVARYITPVPGGVGPMTIAMLMYNTVLGANMNDQ